MKRLPFAAALAASLAAAALGACGTAGVVCSFPADTACGNSICVNLKSDPNHCGACGNTCATGQSCADLPDAGPTCVCPSGATLSDGGLCTFAK